MPVISKFGSWAFCIVATIVSAFLLFGQDCRFHPAYRAPMEIAPQGADVSVPITAEVGELVQLEAHGTSVVWFSEPHIATVSYGANNECCVVAFRKPGTYLVFSASIADDLSVAVDRHQIEVKGEEPVVVNPVYPVDPVDSDPTLDRLVKFAGPNKAVVAASFRSVANQLQTKLDNGMLVTPAQVVAVTTESNRIAVGSQEKQWRGFFSELERYLNMVAPQTVADHIRVWKQIAAALEK